MSMFVVPPPFPCISFVPARRPAPPNGSPVAVITLTSIWRPPVSNPDFESYKSRHIYAFLVMHI